MRGRGAALRYPETSRWCSPLLTVGSGGPRRGGGLGVDLRAGEVRRRHPVHGGVVGRGASRAPLGQITAAAEAGDGGQVRTPWGTVARQSPGFPVGRLRMGTATCAAAGGAAGVAEGNTAGCGRKTLDAVRSTWLGSLPAGEDAASGGARGAAGSGHLTHDRGCRPAGGEAEAPPEGADGLPPSRAASGSFFHHPRGHAASRLAAR